MNDVNHDKVESWNVYIYIYIFEYITMSKDSSARYYPKNKERTHEIRYQYLSEE